MSADDWGPCPACGTPLSRANASRLRSGAVLHVGCKGLQAGPSEPVGIVVTAPRGFPAALREEIALSQAAKDRLSALGAGLPDPAMPGEGPLVQASGLTDFEALGRERYWDTSPAMREAQLPGIVAQLRPGTPQEDRRFADGWLAEHARAKADEQRMSVATSAGPLNGLLCSVCREPQFDTPSGEVCKNGHGGAEGVPPPPARKERRRVSLREPLTEGQRDAFVALGPRGLAATLPPADAEELRRGLAAEVARAAAEPKDDVVLQALHVASGANGIGVGEVRPNIDVRCGPELHAVEAHERAFAPIAVAIAALGPGAVREVVVSPVRGSALRSDEVPVLVDPELGPDGTEIVTLAPLAKAEPPAAPEPVHMLVPGFPGHACCGWPVEAPKPAEPPARARRGSRGKPGTPASPGRPATKGTPVTTDRSKATCSDCLELYDDAERLASRIEELEPEPTPEEQEVAEEVAERRAEARARADLDLAQLRILEQEKARSAAPPSPRPEGELVHLFDGFPAAGTRTRCGIATSRKFEALTSGKVELFAVPFLAGHPRCCPACAALPQPPNARSYGAFVPPDCVV